MSDTVAATFSDPVSTTTGAIELAAQGARKGAADAREAAARTWDATSLFLSRFAYTASYTISYGVVFPAALLARSVPTDNVAVRGLVDGARAAIRHVDEIHGLPAAVNPETHLILNPEEARHPAEGEPLSPVVS